VEENSRRGVKAGDPKSTDPEGKIKQPYCVLAPIRPYPGFLTVSVVPALEDKAAQATFSLYDENGSLRYVKTKTAK